MLADELRDTDARKPIDEALIAELREAVLHEASIGALLAAIERRLSPEERAFADGVEGSLRRVLDREGS